MRTPLWLILFSILTWSFVPYEENYFRQIDLTEGLPFSTVNSIAQDQSGIMWIGTSDGLSRFDGLTFTHFAVAPNSARAIPSSGIIRLVSDSKGRMWVHFDFGQISVFDPVSETFQHLLPFSYERAVTCQVEDASGNVWVGTSKGLYRFDPGLNRSICFNPASNQKIPLLSEKVNTLYIDNHAICWVGTENGLARYINDQAGFEIFTTIDGEANCMSNPSVHCMAEDQYGHLLVGTGWGLNTIVFSDDQRKPHKPVRFVRDFGYIAEGKLFAHSFYQKFLTDSQYIWMATNNGLVRAEMKPDGHLDHNLYLYQDRYQSAFADIWFGAMEKDVFGSIWITTTNPRNGIFIFSKDENKMVHLTQRPGDPRSLARNEVNSLFQDNKGVMWVGTQKGGISVMDLFQKRFGNINRNPLTSNSLTDDDIYSLYRGGDKYLWVGSINGLTRVSPDNKLFVQYHYVKGSNAGLLGRTVGEISQDPSGFLWLGYYDHKISRLYPATGRFEHYQHLPFDSTSFQAWSMRDILTDSKGRTWMAATTHGLIRWDRHADRFTYYMHDPQNANTISDNWIWCISEADDGSLWLGTRNGGLNRFDPQTNTFIHYKNNPSDPKSFPTNEIRHIHFRRKVKDGKFYLATGQSGLCIFDSKANTWELLTVANGLPGITLHGILEDESGRMWISTNHGLSCYDPEKRQFTNYYMEDGLTSNEFNEGAYFQSSDGMCYFGTNRGVTYFYPPDITPNPYPSEINLTKLYVFNKPVETGAEVNGQRILELGINMAKRITLRHRNNDFSIAFSAIHYAAPTKILYRYKLEGYEDDWKETGASNRLATYTNLSPGRYTFVVDATNTDQVWNNTPRKLEVVILPPWWKTWWFRVLVVTLMASVIFTWNRMRLRRLLHQKRWLTAEVAKQTQKLVTINQLLTDKTNQIETQNELLEKRNLELKASKEETEEIARRLHQADEEKIRFFTNISHEIRTPLTLILSPIQRMVRQNPSKNPDLVVVYRNTRRLLNLINQLLDLRKLESGKLPIAREVFYPVQFFEEIATLFSGFANTLGVHFDYTIDTALPPSISDPDKIEKIISNLLLNAFKFTPRDGTVHFGVQEVHSPLSIDEAYTLVCGQRVDFASGKQAQIVIRDTGKGFDPNMTNILFTPYSSPDIPTSATFASTGLGLAFTKDLVNALGGSLLVKTQKDVGTEFLIVLPLVPVSDAQVTAGNLTSGMQYTKDILISPEEINLPEIVPVSREQIGDQKVVLVAEDHPELLAYLRRELSDEYYIVAAADGLTALKMATELIPDAIVSDLVMPGLDGASLCREIKADERTSHIPFVLLTALHTDEQQLSGLESGADDYITKPFSSDVLKARLRTLIDNRMILWNKFSTNIEDTSDSLSLNPTDNAFLNKVFALLDANLADPDYDVEGLSADIRLSRRQFYRRIKTLTNLSVNDFIKSYRLRKAAELLASRHINVSEAAYAVGFRDPSYFTKCFLKQFNKLPSEF